MHQMFREALAGMINEAGGFRVFADAETGSEAVELCRRDAPDILVIPVELDGGDGIEVTREILQARPKTRVILLQSTRDEDTTLRAIRSGALGLVLTTTPANLLIEALRTVAQGRAYVGPVTWDVVLNRLKNTPREARASGLQGLSPRHKQILALIVQGRTSNEIAAQLGAPVGVNREQRKALMRRMHVKTTPELILAALAKGFKA
jgi:two-component system response regulator NreC